MTPSEIRDGLAASTFDARFSALQGIAAMLADNPEAPEAQALLIRALEDRERFKGLEPLVSALLRETGLYPYADPGALPARDLIALELHRAPGRLGERLFFHRMQARVYRKLLAGRNVILSAPTSFGKSLIVDAVVASGRFRRIVLVVPTIALIDETRRRLAAYSGTHKIVTHGSQAAADDGRGTVFVLTQERAIERQDLGGADLVVVDEFYKLDPSGGGAERAAILNHALYVLLKSARQFYLLGPNVGQVPAGFKQRFDADLVVTDYATVATDVCRIRAPKREHPQRLLDLARGLDGQTLVYCQSPGSARRVAALLAEAAVASPGRKAQAAAAWTAKSFHPDWIVPRALAASVGVHHGRLPRALGQMQVRLFNEGEIKFLVCTSTLIEGVNTSAKHVVVYDNQVATNKLDYFTYKNIQGRSGRMFRHFVGTVHVFHDPPERDLLNVDIPAFSQGEKASDSLLVQLDEDDLTPEAAERVDRIRRQRELSFETIRANRHIEPSLQVETARILRRSPAAWYSLLRWQAEPTGDQLYRTCELLFETLLRGVGRDTVRSGRQLGLLLSRLRQIRSPSAFVRSRAADTSGRGEPGERIEEALDFLRTWASFHVPRGLAALERIQAEVFGSMGLRPGTYGPFVARLESLFLPQPIAALDEYGLPLSIAEKIAGRLRTDGGLDPALADLKRLNATSLGLDPFETHLLWGVQDGL